MSKKHKQKPHHGHAATNHATPTEHRREEFRSIYPVRIEPTTEDHQWQADQKGNWKKQLNIAKWLNVITAMAALGAFVYAFIAYLQWSDAHRNFMVDQRAWIKITLGQTADMRENSPLSATMNAVNVGKSPAKNIQWHVSFEKVRSSESPTLQFEGLPHFATTTGIMFPSDQLGPRDIPFFDPTTKKTALLSHDDVVGLKSGDFYFVIYSFVSYKDIFGHEHRTTFCQFAIPEEARGHEYQARKCTDYNSTDNN